ncbi:hypothetical protein LYNGBM3L_65140 [Moorena producens 3L]|uniref:Uncharacterized protein n=1 Tax=Moorena producens 3L TaxID=489825 RepID=F4Y1Z6_9CYAN|nr:hypothetical protein LYNGBM3L_65140 [Moorena producens 3L]
MSYNLLKRMTITRFLMIKAMRLSPPDQAITFLLPHYNFQEGMVRAMV